MPKKPWDPTPQIGGKNGTKRHLLVDERGVPLSLVVTGANRHDVTQLETVLDNIVITRPAVHADCPQHLCADAGYVGQPALDIIKARGYTPHIRSRGEEKLCKQSIPGYRARRWVVEACHSWLNRYRKNLIRYEKKAANYLALLHLACAITTWRRAISIYG